MRLRFTILNLIAFLLLGASAKAESSPVKTLLENFENICLANVQNISEVETALSSIESRPAGERIRRYARPLEGDLIGAWHAKAENFNFIVTTTQSRIKNKDVSTCSILTEIRDRKSLLESLQKTFKAQKVEDETSGHTHYRSYITGNKEDRVLITVSHSILNKVYTLNLGGVYPAP